jgi:hypothetical protein
MADMALAGTLTHRKTRKLARLMGLAPACALGVVEAMLHVTAARTADGAIGRLSNQDIAEEMFWDQDADALIANFIEAGWLDPNPTHRLVVHDWSEHASDTVHAQLARKRQWFADGAAPRLTRLNSNERPAAVAFYSTTKQAQVAQRLPERSESGSGSATEVATDEPEMQEVPLPSLPCPTSLPQPPTGAEREGGDSESGEPSNGHKPNRYFAVLESDFLVRTIRGDEWLQVEEQLDRWHGQGYRVSLKWFQEACVEARADCKEKTGRFPRTVTWLINHLTELIGDMEPRNG